MKKRTSDRRDHTLAFHASGERTRPRAAVSTPAGTASAPAISIWGWKTPHSLPQAINDLYRHELRLWLNLYLPSVKLVKKVLVGSKVRRVYDAARTPLERVLAGGQFNKDQAAELKKLHLCLDPFQLEKVIDQNLERIYERANQRLSPKATQESQAAHTQEKTQRSRRNGCGRACKSRKKRAIRTFPQPRRRRVFGYISNVSTAGPRVTFLNGLTRRAVPMGEQWQGTRTWGGI